MAHVMTSEQRPESFLNVEPRMQLMQTWSENAVGGYNVVTPRVSTEKKENKSTNKL